MKKRFRAGVIGASSESIYAIEEAKKRGIYVIAIDGSEEAPGLQCADEGHVVDIRDVEAVFSFFDSNPIDFLLPVPVGRILTTSAAECLFQRICFMRILFLIQTFTIVAVRS